MVVDPVGSAKTGPVDTKQVNKAMIMTASIVVFMKALLLLVEERRWTHSLAISLIQSANGSELEACRSLSDPGSFEPIEHPSRASR